MIINGPYDQVIDWHVFFDPGKSLWSRNYHHVSLAGYSNETWLYLDLRRGSFASAVIYKHDDVIDFLSYHRAYQTIVRFGPSRGQSRSYGTPMTCVGFAKHVLGIRCSALLPDTFFKKLVSDFDAEVLNAPESTIRNARDESGEGAR